MKKIAIFETDHLAHELKDTHDSYPKMFEQLFHTVDPSLVFETFTVVDGCFPDDLSQFWGVVITGSKSSAYDTDPWINTLVGLLRLLSFKKTPVAGICFGHQLIAQALGGDVVRSSNGWGVGVHSYELCESPSWMKSSASNDRFQLLVSHQDQVVSLPSSAVVLATSDFCPIAMYQIGETLLGIQGHPEFAKSYSQDLLDLRREALGEDIYRSGRNSLAQDHHGELVITWVLEFFDSCQQDC